MTLRLSTLSLGLVAALTTLTACSEEGQSGPLDNPIANEQVERPAEGDEDHAGEGAEATADGSEKEAEATAKVEPPTNGYVYPNGTLFCDAKDKRLARTGYKGFPLTPNEESGELTWSSLGHADYNIGKIEAGTGKNAGRCVAKTRGTDGEELLVRTRHFSDVSSTSPVMVVVDNHSGAKIEVTCEEIVSGACDRKKPAQKVAHKHTKNLGDGFSVVFDDDEAHKNDKVATK